MLYSIPVNIKTFNMKTTALFALLAVTVSAAPHMNKRCNHHQAGEASASGASAVPSGADASASGAQSGAAAPSLTAPVPAQQYHKHSGHHHGYPSWSGLGPQQVPTSPQSSAAVPASSSEAAPTADASVPSPMSSISETSVTNAPQAPPASSGSPSENTVTDAPQVSASSIPGQVLAAPAPSSTPAAPAGNGKGTAQSHPDRWTATKPDLGANGFQDGNYADGLPRYFRYKPDDVYSRNGPGKYERSPMPVRSDIQITGNPTDSDLAGTSDISKRLVENHNLFRAQFGSAALTWDAGLAAKSRSWATNCKWEHAGGDNLSWISGTTCSADDMVNMWTAEYTDYPFGHPEQNAYSHFTQVVWKGATKVGCSWNTCNMEGGNRVMFSCVYDHGNMIGDFANNVPNWIDQNGMSLA